MERTIDIGHDTLLHRRTAHATLWLRDAALRDGPSAQLRASVSQTKSSHDAAPLRDNDDACCSNEGALLPSSNSFLFFEVEEIMLRGTFDVEWLVEEAVAVPVVEIVVLLPRSARKTS